MQEQTSQSESFQKTAGAHKSFSKSIELNQHQYLKQNRVSSPNSDTLSSRIPAFHSLSSQQRLEYLREFAGLDESEVKLLANYGSISETTNDIFIENATGTYSLPLGVATNFLINGSDYLVPMAVEESSVLAAASFAAKLIRQSGGFDCQSTENIMTGQIQLKVKTDHPQEVEVFYKKLVEAKGELLDYANHGMKSLISRGGGTRDIEFYWNDRISSFILHVHIHTVDAMGANIVNSICEKLTSPLLDIIPASPGLRILTNLNTRRMTKATCRVQAKYLATEQFSAQEVVQGIVEAYEFAAHDVYRACTHNKGIMNGIDSVVIATGNDWRAVEAGAHAYAALKANQSTIASHVYSPLSCWEKNTQGDLIGTLELPMSVGTVGGVTKLHPTAQIALKILKYPSASTLAQIIVATGLAQNFSALRALATEGIQKGHMSLHQKNLDLLASNQKPKILN